MKRYWQQQNLRREKRYNGEQLRAVNVRFGRFYIYSFFFLQNSVIAQIKLGYNLFEKLLNGCR